MLFIRSQLDQNTLPQIKIPILESRLIKTNDSITFLISQMMISTFYLAIELRKQRFLLNYSQNFKYLQ